MGLKFTLNSIRKMQTFKGTDAGIVIDREMTLSMSKGGQKQRFPHH